MSFGQNEKSRCAFLSENLMIKMKRGGVQCIWITCKGYLMIGSERRGSFYFAEGENSSPYKAPHQHNKCKQTSASRVFWFFTLWSSSYFKVSLLHVVPAWMVSLQALWHVGLTTIFSLVLTILHPSAPYVPKLYLWGCPKWILHAWCWPCIYSPIQVQGWCRWWLHSKRCPLSYQNPRSLVKEFTLT